MILRLLYPDHGRDAWSAVGGTLNSKGTAPGGYYRAPVGTIQMPGLAAYRALGTEQPIDINTYAVYKAVQGIQREVGADEDGLFGSDTAALVKSWQAKNGLDADGIFGPASAKAMFKPLAIAAAQNLGPSSLLAKLVVGHVGFESSWDPGAVGYVDPRDLGIGQINGPAHSDLTPDFRLSPRLALGFVANFVFDNLNAMVWSERDSIVAYNLGVGGARAWVRAGRPDSYKGTNVAVYIKGVLAAAD